MAMWNPWRGCHRCSEGCRFCYIHKGDAKRGVDTDWIVRAENFDAPAARKKNGEYRMKSGQLVYLCFSTDFLLEDADAWRGRSLHTNVVGQRPYAPLRRKAWICGV